MTTTAKAAGNGSTTTDTATEKTSLRSVSTAWTRLREDECYHLTDLIATASARLSTWSSEGPQQGRSAGPSTTTAARALPRWTATSRPDPQRSPRLRPGRHRVPVPGGQRPGRRDAPF